MGHCFLVQNMWKHSNEQCLKHQDKDQSHLCVMAHVLISTTKFVILKTKN